jgi:hypothetical protein
MSRACSMHGSMKNACKILVIREETTWQTQAKTIG